MATNWQRVERNTSYLEVPNGRIYRIIVWNENDEVSAVSTCFVPIPDKKLKLKVGEVTEYEDERVTAAKLNPLVQTRDLVNLLLEWTTDGEDPKISFSDAIGLFPDGSDRTLRDLVIESANELGLGLSDEFATQKRGRD